jgi:DNA-binding HxlR family transcriptional regulator
MSTDPSEEIRAQHIQLQETDADLLLADIIAHPIEQPTFRELAFLNPDLDRQELTHALAALQEEELLNVITTPEEDRVDEIPHEFYTLSDDGRAFAEAIGLFEAEDEWKDALQLVDFPEDIRKIMDAPRPEDGE